MPRPYMTAACPSPPVCSAPARRGREGCGTRPALPAQHGAAAVPALAARAIVVRDRGSSEWARLCAEAGDSPTGGGTE
eukprot:scaffold26996_cov39-Isochrysis_galbana.AAC.1